MEFTEFINSLGYLGLFISALLAATVLPFSSEAVMLGLLQQHWNPLLLVLIAGSGNTLGSVINYALGYWANDGFLQRQSAQHQRRLARAERFFDRYGSWSMLFAWVPVIGDPLTLLAGLLRLRFVVFLVLVALGKFGRYAVLAYTFS